MYRDKYHNCENVSKYRDVIFKSYRPALVSFRFIFLYWCTADLIKAQGQEPAAEFSMFSSVGEVWYTRGSTNGVKEALEPLPYWPQETRIKTTTKKKTQHACYSRETPDEGTWTNTLSIWYHFLFILC